jgi:hypothetical protein
MRPNDLLEPSKGDSSAEEIDREAGSAPTAIGELLPVNRRGKTQLQQQAAHILGKTLGRGGVEDGPAVAMDATIALKQLRDQDGEGTNIPGFDDTRNSLVEGPLALQTADIEQKPYRAGGLPTINPNRADR